MSRGYNPREARELAARDPLLLLLLLRAGTVEIPRVKVEEALRHCGRVNLSPGAPLPTPTEAPQAETATPTPTPAPPPGASGYAGPGFAGVEVKSPGGASTAPCPLERLTVFFDDLYNSRESPPHSWLERVDVLPGYDGEAVAGDL